MKLFGIAIGLAALLAAGTASASPFYDTITGYTSSGSSKLGVASLVSGTNYLTKDPMGDEFTVSSTISLANVVVNLASSSTSVNGQGFATDTGSVMLFIVPDAGGVPSNSPVGSPTAHGVKLNGAISLGSIADSALLGNNIFSSITVTPSTSISLLPGNYWLEITDGVDPNNGGSGTVASTNSTAEWAYFNLASLVGSPIGTGSSMLNGALAPLKVASPGSTGLPVEGTPLIFMAQINSAPEPASLALLGVGLFGLGLGKRFRRKA